MIVSIALFPTITFIVFGPLSLYLSQTNEFWFSIFDVLFTSSCLGIISFLTLFVLGLCLHGRFREFYICIIFGITLGLYIQGNYINVNYGILDGKSIDWNEYIEVGVINSVIWMFCIIMPFLFRVFCHFWYYFRTLYTGKLY